MQLISSDTNEENSVGKMETTEQTVPVKDVSAGENINGVETLENNVEGSPMENDIIKVKELNAVEHSENGKADESSMDVENTSDAIPEITNNDDLTDDSAKFVNGDASIENHKADETNEDVDNKIITADECEPMDVDQDVSEKDNGLNDDSGKEVPSMELNNENPIEKESTTHEEIDSKNDVLENNTSSDINIDVANSDIENKESKADDVLENHTSVKESVTKDDIEIENDDDILNAPDQSASSVDDVDAMTEDILLKEDEEFISLRLSSDESEDIKCKNEEIMDNKECVETQDDKNGSECELSLKLDDDIDEKEPTINESEKDSVLDAIENIENNIAKETVSHKTEVEPIVPVSDNDIMNSKENKDGKDDETCKNKNKIEPAIVFDDDSNSNIVDSKTNEEILENIKSITADESIDLNIDKNNEKSIDFDKDGNKKATNIGNDGDKVTTDLDKDANEETMDVDKDGNKESVDLDKDVYNESVDLDKNGDKETIDLDKDRNESMDVDKDGNKESVDLDKDVYKESVDLDKDRNESMDVDKDGNKESVDLDKDVYKESVDLDKNGDKETIDLDKVVNESMDVDKDGNKESVDLDKDGDKEAIDLDKDANEKSIDLDKDGNTDTMNLDKDANEKSIDVDKETIDCDIDEKNESIDLEKDTNEESINLDDDVNDKSVNVDKDLNNEKIDLDQDDKEKTDDSTSSKDASKKDEACISLDDEDDDIVVVNEVSSKKTPAKVSSQQSIDVEEEKSNSEPEVQSKMDCDTIDKTDTIHSIEKTAEKNKIPIFPLSVMKQLKPKLSAMSRDDLEEFIVVKIVESISGRSAISDLQMKLKAQEKSTEEWKKKVMALAKQNKDLNIVMKNLCDEQQKRLVDNPLPIKITRSVGLQVGFPGVRAPPPNTNNVHIPITAPKIESSTPSPTVNKQPVKPPAKPSPSQVTKSVVTNTNIRSTRSKTLPQPVVTPSTPQTVVQIGTPVLNTIPNKEKKTSNPPKLLFTALSPNKRTPNIPGLRILKSSVEVKAEKRPASSLQSIDLTDDEPPAKIPAMKTPPRPTPIIRPINTNQLTKLQGVANSPNRPVYIPVSSHNITPNSIVVNRGKVANKLMTNFRPIGPPIRPSHQVQIRPIPPQHPAPLPQSINYRVKYHPDWKLIPPRPTLKIARVDNGIVISWEMEEFSDTQHEAIASYQIFAYQEASIQPTTDLWKKIGDVKALPLPMACTLTHFMAGFKYYFAVRAIDVKSRVGAFSAPGQITLVNNKK